MSESRILSPEEISDDIIEITEDDREFFDAVYKRKGLVTDEDKMKFWRVELGGQILSDEDVAIWEVFAKAGGW